MIKIILFSFRLHVSPFIVKNIKRKRKTQIKKDLYIYVYECWRIAKIFFSNAQGIQCKLKLNIIKCLAMYYLCMEYLGLGFANTT